MLMVGKALESLQRVCSGEISPHREQKKRSTALGAFIHQCGPDDSSRRQLSQNGDPLQELYACGAK